VLNYYGVQTNQDDLSCLATSGKLWVGMSTQELVDAAARCGMEAHRVNHGTSDQLKACIDNGIPVIARGAWSDSAEHYLVVIGYRTNPSGKIVEWTVMDPAENSGPTTMTASAFEQFWSRDDSMKLLTPGMDHFFVAVAPRGSTQAAHLPPEDLGGDAAQLATYDALSQIVYGLQDVLYPFDAGGHFIGVREWLRQGLTRGVFQVTGGVLQLGFAVPGWLLSELGDSIGGDVGKFVSNVGDLLGDIGCDINNVVKGVEHTVDHAIDNAGDVIDELGDGDLLGATEEFGDGVADFVTDTAKTIGDGISDVAEDVGDFVSDVFSGW
jgi:hypothetical protein